MNSLTLTQADYYAALCSLYFRSKICVTADTLAAEVGVHRDDAQKALYRLVASGAAGCTAIRGRDYFWPRPIKGGLHAYCAPPGRCRTT